MTVILVLLMCGIFLGIDWLFGKKLVEPVKVQYGPGITYVPELGWCMQDGGTLVEEPKDDRNNKKPVARLR